MLHVLDVRDAMDSERFQQVQFDPMNDPKKQIVPSASTVSVGGAAGADGAEGDKDQGECTSLFPGSASGQMKDVLGRVFLRGLLFQYDVP